MVLPLQRGRKKIGGRGEKEGAQEGGEMLKVIYDPPSRTSQT